MVRRCKCTGHRDAVRAKEQNPRKEPPSAKKYLMVHPAPDISEEKPDRTETDMDSSIPSQKTNAVISQKVDSQIPSLKDSIATKRHCRCLFDTIESTHEILPSFPIPKKSLTKKSKSSNEIENIPLLLKPIEQFINEKNPPFFFSFVETCPFLENSFNSKHPEIAAKNFTGDPSKLIPMLQKIHEIVHDKRLKNKITRLKTKLSINTSLSTTEEESEPWSTQ
ncbi:hypothetical protein WA026_002605 [Henosepilachna vigintioctopunctata]|uniref:Uncharacterized protein n=1 Tax=Henosepilachna vigintioctopunctata TaxID=420089 RepID=A0AAW1U252_9CUCU